MNTDNFGTRLMPDLRHAVALALTALSFSLSGCGAPDETGSTEVLAQSDAEAAEVIQLWQGLPPGAKPPSQQESRVINDETWRPIVEIHNVSAPSLTVIRPAAGEANGSAMVVLPGGAFGILAWDIEGTEVGEFLAERGITAFVLKYRVKDPTLREVLAFLTHLSDLGKLLGPKRDVAVEDAMQAMRILRRDAATYGIDPDRIGMMGFSAGAITTMTVLQRSDDSTRPNVAASIYGMAIEPDVPLKAPPLLMVVAKDDPLMAGASADIQKAWQTAGKNSELHVLESGEHGFGMGRADTDSMRFAGLLEAWLRRQAFVEAAQ
jgi:acetyl esterase/lipase